MCFYVILALLYITSLSIFAYEPVPSDTTNIESFLFALPEEERAAKMNELAKEVVANQPDKAIDYANRALRIALSKNLPTEIANSYSNLGLAHDYKKMYSDALDYHVEALRVREIHKDKVGMAKSLNNIGIIYYNLRAYKEAIEFYEKSLQIRIGIGDTNEIFKSYNNLGIASHVAGDYGKALEYYFETLKIVEAINRIQDLADVLNKIGSVYYSTKIYDEALIHFKRALEVSQKENQPKEVNRALNNMGNVYFETGKIKEALQSYEQALQIAEDINDLQSVGITMNNMGMIHKQLGNYDKALNYCMGSIQAQLDIKDSSSIFHPLTTVAQIYMQKKNYDEALVQLDRAFEIARLQGEQRQMLTAYEIYHELYRDLGNYKTALDYYKLYTSTKDNLMNDEVNKKIAELKITYAVDKKDKENIILRQQNEHQRRMNNIQKTSFIAISFLVFMLMIMFYFRHKNNVRTNKILNEKNIKIIAQTDKMREILDTLIENEKKLTEANSTKDKFFSIIAHDLKNPLHAIVLSADTIRSKSHVMSESQLVELVSQIHKAGVHLSNLLENLLYWSKTQSGSLKAERQMIDLSYLISENVKLLSEAAKNKGIEIFNNNGGPVLAYGDPNMVNTVIRNLISNAIKFTSRDGKVAVSTKLNSEYVELKVKDTGVGISEEDMKKLFRIDVHYSTFGTSREKGTGLGLILCKEFMDMNNGLIEAKSAIGEGTEVTIKIPSKPIQRI